MPSTAADCLLTDGPAHLNLVGYCDFSKMLTYRLDTESALILASAVECVAPGSASAGGAAGNACPTATIEHMTKLSKDEVAALTRSLAGEWKAVLTKTPQGSDETTGTPECPSGTPSGSPRRIQTASIGRRGASERSGAWCRSPLRRWRPLVRWLHSVRTSQAFAASARVLSVARLCQRRAVQARGISFAARRVAGHLYRCARLCQRWQGLRFASRG